MTKYEIILYKYEIILYWSHEDQAFIAEVPELAGCAADGVTRQEALAKAETVIAEWPGNRAGTRTPHPRTQGPAFVCLTLLLQRQPRFLQRPPAAIQRNRAGVAHLL